MLASQQKNAKDHLKDRQSVKIAVAVYKHDDW